MLDMQKIDWSSFLIGRVILGLYFFVFGFGKVFTYQDVESLMLLKEVPLVALTLPLTIAIQTIFGLLIIFGNIFLILPIVLFLYLLFSLINNFVS